MAPDSSPLFMTYSIAHHEFYNYTYTYMKTESANDKVINIVLSNDGNNNNNNDVANTTWVQPTNGVLFTITTITF